MTKARKCCRGGIEGHDPLCENYGKTFGQEYYKCAQCRGFGSDPEAIKHDTNCFSYGRWYTLVKPKGPKPYTKEDRIKAALQIFGLVDESARSYLEWTVRQLIDEYKHE